jgi:DNA polymerase-4
VRLIGVGVSGFVSDALPLQMNLFNDNKKKNSIWEKVDRAVDTITKKYGKNVIKRATLK